MTDHEETSETRQDLCEVTTRYGVLAVPDVATDLIGRFLSRYGEWAWLEAVFVASVIPDGACVLDAGAFVGTFGLGLARARPLRLLCCIEANPAIAPLLRKNVAAGSPCGSVVIQALLTGPGVRAGTGHSLPSNLGSMSFKSASPESGGETETTSPIPAVDLAGLRATYGTFDLIKLDIEGMEQEALRGDADFLATGRTTLWLEANEDPRTLDVAAMLLSWNLDLYYFAFPAFNPGNFNGSPDPIFISAFEAGLLAAPATPPSLSPELQAAGCILRPVRGIDDLKDALWRTPRWGMQEWEGATTTQELTALAARTLRGESFETFLTPAALAAPDANKTLWERLDIARAELHETHSRLSRTKDELRDTEARATASLAELEAERQRSEQLQTALRHEEALAEQRLNQLLEAQIIAAERLDQLQEAQITAAERLDQLQATRAALAAIQASTVWRVTAPVRRLIDRQPVLRGLLRRTRVLAGTALRRWRQRRAAPVSQVSAAPAPPDQAASIDPSHRAAITPYFDAAYYRATNPDVAQAGIDPIDHFLQQGWREGRAPNPFFDVSYYLAVNQDVAAAGLNPLLHYAWSGKAEGRRTQRPLDAKRRALANAIPPRIRALDWAGGRDRSAPLSRAALIAALSGNGAAARTAVAVSHDDYAENVGGLQNVIVDEQRAFDAAGWRYLHLSPAAPLPILADPLAPEDYRLKLRLNGEAIGVVRFSDLTSALAALRQSGARLSFVFHHLAGHVPELLATLPTRDEGDPIAWTHDFFTLCPNANLMRNDVKFCGAPPSGSAACGICVYGTERPDHERRVQAFFDTICPIVLAPSAVTRDFWQRRAGYTHATTAVVPLARLTMTTAADVRTDGQKLRIAHLGGVAMHKGWPVFEQLSMLHEQDDRYEFYHLGIGGYPSPRYIQDPVRVGPTQRDAMIQALLRHRIDVVVCWSLWPETFCFTVHEALAAGTFVVARQDAGAVWPAIAAHAPDQGVAVADETALFRLFQTGDIQRLVASASRVRSALSPGGNTADVLLRRPDTLAVCAETEGAQP